MTAAPDPAEITPPTDPAAYGRRRRGLGLTAWAAIIGALLCVAGGFALARYIPRLLPAAPSTAPASTAGEASSLSPETAPPPAVAPLAGLPSPEPAAPSAEIVGLQARVEALEASQGRTINAAAAALAAATLADATQGSGPFETELAALERVLPMSAEVRALRPYAETGAPSRIALAAEFNAAAAKASVAARDPGERAGFFDRVIHSLSSIVTIRRVGSTTGDGPDALLARAGDSAAEGDIEGALKTLRGLPPTGAEAMRPWAARAQQRVAVDRQVSAIRALALSDLMAVSREAS